VFGESSARKAKRGEFTAPFILPNRLHPTERLRHAEFKSALYSLTAHYENNVVNNDDIGAFYRYANNKFCTKSSIGPLLRSDGSVTSDPPEKAELLQCILKKLHSRQWCSALFG
jgi:hypothetical protein